MMLNKQPFLMENNITKEIIISKKIKSCFTYRDRFGSNPIIRRFLFPGFYFVLDFSLSHNCYLCSSYCYYHEEDTKRHMIINTYEEVMNLVETYFERYYNSLKNDSSIKEILSIKEDCIIINYPDKIELTTTRKQTPFFDFEILDNTEGLKELKFNGEHIGEATEEKMLKFINLQYKDFLYEYNHIYKEKHNFFINLFPFLK